MRAQDQASVSAAASWFQAWILVRPTNPASVAYIGQTGFRPKPIHVKAKTADKNVGFFLTAGLVVSPSIHPTAFHDAARAMSYWGETQALLAQKIGDVSLDEDKQSKHYGCLKLNNSFLHGDYDLYDIIFTKDFRGQSLDPRRNFGVVDRLNGVTHIRDPRFSQVQQFINTQIGVADMVQHGGQAQFGTHTGEPLTVFSPDGLPGRQLSGGEVRSWYEAMKRKLVGEKW
jgi:hypothetical protein